MSDNNTSDERLKREPDSARAPRSMSDRRVTEDRGLDEERLRQFRMQMFSDALPNLPPIDGYHTVWLSTTNTQDPIHAREALGYTLVTAEDVPGFNPSLIEREGPNAGAIKVAEMIAYKIPEEYYQAFMRIRHHEQPLEMEEAIVHAAERAGASMGADDIDGMDDVRSIAPAPRRFD